MPKAPTASDVARLAEVSRSAVSLVLSGRGDHARLSEETQDRIRKAAEELNYHPNAAGRSLVRGRTETIALVIRDLRLLEVDPFLLPLLSGILQATKGQGYRVLVESAQSNDDTDPFGNLMDSGRIDGMIVENPDYGDKSLMRLIKSGRPVVVMGSQGLPEEYSVGIDDYRIGYVATEHLTSIGRRRIAHIAYSEKGIYAVDNRMKGYRDAMHAAGLKVNPKLIVHANFSTESGYKAMTEILKMDGSPDAIFVSSDAVAIGVVAAAKDAGLRVPEDIAIASVDDISFSNYVRPSLTTVTSEPHVCGRLAGEMLIDLMSGRRPETKNVLVDTRLIVRESTATSPA